MSVKELKGELQARKVSLIGLVEKQDLIDALVNSRLGNNGENSRNRGNAAAKRRTASSSPSAASTRSGGSTVDSSPPPRSPKRMGKQNSSGNNNKSSSVPRAPKKASSSSSSPSKSGGSSAGRTMKSDDVVDPSRWKCQEVRFNGSAAYESMGRQETVRGKSIQDGVARMRQNPDRYVAITYQADSVDWPTSHQQYTLIHREGTEGYEPRGTSPSGPFAAVVVRYERCAPFPNDELPRKYRDKYTDSMSYEGRKLHGPRNKPVLPGRGMGVGDAPNLKIIGDVDPSDIHQGTVGDCWLLSAISALAEFDGAVKRLFRKTSRLDERPLPDEPNRYVVSLYDLTTWKEVDVVIDERLCVQANGSGQLLGARPSEDGELWVSYLEKALAAHCGGWDKIKGGQCTHAWALLTGCKHQYTIRKNAKTGKYGCFAKFNPQTRQWARHTNSPHDCSQSVWPVAWPDVGGGGTGEMTEEQLFMRMCAWDDENYIVGASVDGVSDKHRTDGMVNNHAYSVIEAHNDVAGTDIDLFKVRNPWGKGEIENGLFDDDGPGWDRYPKVKRALNPVVADDGIFYLTKKEFFHHFTTVYLSASNMTEFLED